MRARLVPLDDTPAIDLTHDLTLVGRSGECCDVTIDHKSVSKLHCVLVKTDGLVLVRDLGSTNGTRVNGQRVRRAALLPNDHLSIAAFRYRVRFGDAPDSDPGLPALPAAEVNNEGSDEHPVRPPEADPVKGPPLRRNPLPDLYTDG